MDAPEGRKFYGSVTVSERGQIVIPVEARRDFSIGTGDKLLVFGDLERGLGIATFAIMQKTMQGAADLFREVGSAMSPAEEANRPGDAEDSVDK
jgi:AbrB family looped-hinge helix DNA binding protein